MHTFFTQISAEFFQKIIFRQEWHWNTFFSENKLQKGCALYMGVHFTWVNMVINICGSKSQVVLLVDWALVLCQTKLRSCAEIGNFNLCKIQWPSEKEWRYLKLILNTPPPPHTHTHPHWKCLVSQPAQLAHDIHISILPPALSRRYFITSP